MINPSGEDSNGWEDIAIDFINRHSSSIGLTEIVNWGKVFFSGNHVLDIGCGFGGPYTHALLDWGITLYGIDASPTLVAEYQRRYPQAIAACESAEKSTLFDRHFDGILAIGVLFLLPGEAQLVLLNKMGSALWPGGRLLFTAPWQVCEWDDFLTGRRSRSLGRDVYLKTLANHDLTLKDEFTDEGENHYFSFIRSRGIKQETPH